MIRTDNAAQGTRVVRRIDRATGAIVRLRNAGDDVEVLMDATPNADAATVLGTLAAFDYAESETHWHVETGLQGYGPDAADSPDGFTVFTDRDQAVMAAREALDDAAEAAHQTAYALAEQAKTYGDPGRGDTFAEAWAELERSDALSAMAANLDGSRANAPLYSADPVEGPMRWQQEIARLLSEAHTQDISHNSRLYVWQCTEPECHGDYVEILADGYSERGACVCGWRGQPHDVEDTVRAALDAESHVTDADR